MERQPHQGCLCCFAAGKQGREALITLSHALQIDTSPTLPIPINTTSLTTDSWLWMFQTDAPRLSLEFPHPTTRRLIQRSLACQKPLTDTQAAHASSTGRMTCTALPLAGAGLMQ